MEETPSDYERIEVVMAPKNLENITMEIKDFLGINYQVITFGPDGIVATGGNGKSKTSIERAWDAATLGFDAEDIALGAELGRVVISAGDFSLSRQVKRNGAEKVTVSEDGGKSEWKQTQTRINEMFGRTLKPIAFMHADKKAQRQMVLDACPVGEITAEDVTRWLDDTTGIIAKNFAVPSIEGKDGLEAVEALRSAFYDARKDANAAVKAKAATLAAAEHNAKAAHDAIPSGVTILPLEKAKAELTAAENARTSLITRGKQATEQAEKMAGTRELIVGLRAHADEILGKPEAIGSSANDMDDALKEIKSAEDALALAEQRLAKAKITRNSLIQADNIASNISLDASRKHAQADDLEASLTAVAIEPVTAEETAAAESAVSAASEAHSLAIYGEQAEGLRLDAYDARKSHDAAKAEADALDKAVKNLTEVAPKELIERSGGIPGMDLTDEGVTLDGKVYANLCGKEQMFFAVELTKRARRGKVKVIPMDGMEALDEDARVDFLRMAVDGGWKVIGTLVTGGPLTIIGLDASKGIPAEITPIKELRRQLIETK
jgi:hypothetical protein